MAKSSGGAGRGGRENPMKPAPQLPVNPDRSKKPQQQRRPAPPIPVPRRTS